MVITRLTRNQFVASTRHMGSNPIISVCYLLEWYERNAVSMYSFDSIIRYSETDENEKLSLTGLVNYFQDCSSFHSETLNIGFEELAEAHRGWILSSWQITIYTRPKMSDKVKISTWPYEFERFFGYRNFMLEGEDGSVFACANSLWVFVNMQTGRPIIPENRFRDVFVLEDRYEGMNYEGRKIIVPENMQRREPFRIRQCNLDTFHHVNNGQYIKFAEEYLPEGFVVGQIRAEYKVSAVYQDMIFPYVQAEVTDRVEEPDRVEDPDRIEEKDKTEEPDRIEEKDKAEEPDRIVVDLQNEEGRTFALVEFARYEQECRKED